ncbi:MAG: transporter substrate-binding domain-containing protein [Gammaproteobacteria bacterium]|nr:transporter substrate-binding domain-containing protein [Gammaproteobacteria bacterium]
MVATNYYLLNIVSNLLPSSKKALQYLVSLSCLFIFIITTTEAVASNKIVIGTGLKPPLVSSEYSLGFLDTLAKEVFRRLDIELEVIILPAERALINANKGIEDGNLLRIKGLEKRYPNLVRVPEKMMDSEFVGYAINDIPQQTGWDRLSGYIVTFPKGWKIFEKNTINAAKTEQVRDPVQMFKLLKEGKADIALYEKWQGILQAKKFGLKNYKVLEPSFVTLEMFMYLNKKHQKLVPEVARVLKEVKQDGTYHSIFNSSLGAM